MILVIEFIYLYNCCNYWW